MFAILISEENLPKITKEVPESSDGHPSYEIYLENTKTTKKNWYLITGYVGSENDKYYDWIIMPEYILVERFQYDENKIKTDWDQIVRK